MTMKRSLPFLTALVVPAMTGAAVFLRGPWLWLPPFFLFVLTPILDVLLGKKTGDVAPELGDAWRSLRYDIWLYLWLPLQLVIQLAAVLYAARASTWPEAAGIVFASGLLGGIGINVAHEWMHRKGRLERALAEVLLTTVAYQHFSVEHILGHHKNVATPRDPGTALRGDVVYGFVPRSVVRSLISAWHLETARVAKLHVRFGLGDRRVRYPVVTALVVVAIALTLGPLAVAAFFAQAAVAIFLLETINYIEHYGLVRDVDERVTPMHSWSSSHRLTSLYLLNLPRHADHHAHASRPFFALRHVDDGPQMPAGYATMLVLSFVPPLWRFVMHPRLDALSSRIANAAHSTKLAGACAPSPSPL
jgi:alkane 1-monooxygenase